jgi:non-ribosomal peptide synthase protein (TIGR01720 family)
VHHLVVDGVSWRVLLEDLYRAATQLAAGQALQLPPKTTSFQAWAERLAAYAQSAEVQAERAYWQNVVQQGRRALPRDHVAGVPQVGTAAEVVGRLTADETRNLLEQVPAAYHSQINDALLSGLVQAAAEWSGEGRLLVELEGHGREELFDDVDLTRTVGWCTTAYPVALDVRGAVGPGAALQAVKEQLRAVPQRGIGYGVLCYLAADEAERAALAVEAEVSFNYLGQVEAGAEATGGLFGGAPEASGPTQDPRGRRRHLLEVSGVVERGQLELVLRYSPELHARATIERLLATYLAALRALIAESAAPEAGGFSPSDFPLAQLDQEKLSKLSALIDKLDSAEVRPYEEC